MYQYKLYQSSNLEIHNMKRSLKELTKVAAITSCMMLTIFFISSISYAESNQAIQLFRKGFNLHFGKNKDDQKAIEFLRKSSDLGHAPAQYLLAQIYEEGVNGKKNINEAIKYYKAAASNGFVHAQSYLGFLYSSGELIRKDYEMAFKYYSMASKQEDGWSQYRLGQFHEYGNGVPLDYEKAIYYYTMSANNDVIKALNALARIYEHRAHESRNNLIIALSWYLIGAQRHNELVSEVNSDRLKSVLSEDEVQQATESANIWKPTNPKANKLN